MIQVCGDSLDSRTGITSMGACAGGTQQEEIEDITGAVLRALETCKTNHQFIASQAEHLQRLRSQCATSALITRQEIRALEVWILYFVIL